MKVRVRGVVAVGAMLLFGPSLAVRAGGATLAADSADATMWVFYASGYAYFVSDHRDYVSPIFTADRDRLHLEARYNYEGLETGSLFLGWNFGAGEEIAVEVTPMVGAVFGDTDGVAPGYRLALSYRAFEFYSEGEYLFDAGDSSENFFYSWSELGYAPTDWSRVGLAGQRTRAYETEVDFQRGLLAGFTYRNVDCTAYLFNLGWSAPTVVIAAGVGFGG
jgi:hypothetical protein